MDPFTGALLLALAIITSFRSGVKRGKDRAADTAVEAATAKKAKAGKTLTPSAKNKLRRRHKAGWWASEIRHGLPVTRTGIHTGWLAHQAAAMHVKAQREAARTTQLDATASFASAVKDHRARQEAARRDIETALAESGVVQDGKRKTVRRTVDEVAAKRAEKAKAYDPAAMDRAWDENWRPADRSRPEPGPFAPKEDGQPAAGDSARKPGRPGCAACGGSGRNEDDTDACMVCRGWGRADLDPSVLDAAPAGSVCAADGRPGTADDPVLLDRDGTHVHRSCLTEAHARYAEALSLHQNRWDPECTECGDPLSLRANDGWAHEDCDRVSNAEADECEVRDGRDPEIVEAELIENGRCPYQTAYGDGGRPAYCGRGITDTGGDEPDEYCLEHDCTVNGDEAGAIQERNERVAELLYRDSFPPCDACGTRATQDDGLTLADDGQAVHYSHTTDPEHPYYDRRASAELAYAPETEGALPMSGDTTFSGVQKSSRSAMGHADQDGLTAKTRKDAAFALADQMVALDVDPVVVSEQMALAEAFGEAEAAYVKASDHAASVAGQLDRYHGGIEEATQAAPGKVAAREFHGE